jgi:2-polyprenyl-3-methyl-5-hydroxy-6-metoxy-1,4-benzoquinol methylase
VSEFQYAGSELDLFAAVHNWKSYWSRQIRPFIAGDVVEAGAGIGSNTAFLDSGHARRWVCLEPDSRLLSRLEENLKTVDARPPHKSCGYEAVCGTLQTLGDQQFDTIIYIDVLEHIEQDREELVLAASRLRPGGHVIVLAPAHQRLFTPFDAAIGHFRRYNKPMLRAISPAGTRLARLRYLDSVGLCASAANLLFLRQSAPTKAQLQFWDQWMIPVSRVVDGLFAWSIGKTIVGIWQQSG